MQEKETMHLIPGPAGKLELNVWGLETNHLDTNQQLEKLKVNPHVDLNVGIVCHPHPLHQGTMNNKVVTTMIRAFRALGLATVRFNFRGVGQSEGKYGEGKGELEDLATVYQWVWQKLPNAKIALGGFSFGAAISALFAASLSNTTLSHSNPNDVNQSLRLLLSIAPPVHHFSLDTLVPPSCPWIIIQGDKDEVVSFESVKLWVENLEQIKQDIKFIVMNEACHFFHGRLIELQENIEKAMRIFII